LNNSSQSGKVKNHKSAKDCPALKNVKKTIPFFTVIVIHLTSNFPWIYDLPNNFTIVTILQINLRCKYIYIFGWG